MTHCSVSLQSLRPSWQEGKVERSGSHSSGQEAGAEGYVASCLFLLIFSVCPAYLMVLPTFRTDSTPWSILSETLLHLDWLP